MPWHPGIGFVSKDEFFNELRRTADCYDAVERLPHVPSMKGTYYVGGMPEPGDGKALEELLSRFCPASKIDGHLILAMFATAIWGGPPGAGQRSLLLPTRVRYWQDKVADDAITADGRHIGFHANEDICTIKARLLSPEATGVRIALIHNVKSLRFSWAELEALITAPVISGKQMYVGEASRPTRSYGL